MSVFETIKAAVTLRQAVEHYGLRVLPNGMTCCPFHEDRHPSLKLNEDYFFCFGCHASGDVIDFTARLFGLSPYAAAQKLETDFGIEAETKPLLFPNHAEPSGDRERLCICVLREYLRYLRIWQLRYRPEEPGDPIHPRFAESMKMLPTVNHLLDCLLGNDLLLAEKTADLLCEEGYIQRLSECLGTLSEKERECA
ncbi:MAG: CHC2 zinc finger domain-containing protein [Candidatus Limivicinus sp.]